MRRQRNMSQVKKTGKKKKTEKEISKMEANNLPDEEFQTLVIRLLAKLTGKIDDLSKNFNREIGNIKKERETIKKNQR